MVTHRSRVERRLRVGSRALMLLNTPCLNLLACGAVLFFGLMTTAGAASSPAAAAAAAAAVCTSLSAVASSLKWEREVTHTRGD